MLCEDHPAKLNIAIVQVYKIQPCHCAGIIKQISEKLMCLSTSGNYTHVEILTGNS